MKKPDHWDIDSQGELTATFTYNGAGRKKIMGTPLEIEFPEQKDVAFTRPQLQNIRRDLYNRIKDIEAELCDLELDNPDDGDTAHWASLFGLRVVSDEEMLLEAELKMAQNAQQIVIDTLNIKETVLEA